MGERLDIANQYIELGYCKSAVLNFCNISSSTYFDSLKLKSASYDKPGRRAPGFSIAKNGSIVLDSVIRDIITDYRAQPYFQNAGGSKVLHEYIERDYGLTINHKKIYRICRENKLLLPKNIKKIKINRKLSENRIINKPNQLWQFDIKTGYIHGENKYFYFLGIIDVFSREIVNYHIGYSCKAQDLLITVNEAIELRKPNLEELVIRSDNGPQMTSYLFYKYINCPVPPSLTVFKGSNPT